MDIDLLSKMIRELVLEHDRVTLPGLGVFIAEMVPASFTDKGYTITPPYRRLSFRPGHDDDGLLVSMYASVNTVSPEVASAAVSDFVSGMKEVLEKKKVIVFPGLGRMRATRENNFFFVSDEDLDIYPAGFGLEPVSLKTHDETREELSTALDGLSGIIGIQEEDRHPGETAEVPAEEVHVVEDELPHPEIPADMEPGGVYGNGYYKIVTIPNENLFSSRKIQIKHRRHCVYAQPVDMKSVQPRQCASQ